MLIVVLPCLDPVLSQLIEKEVFAAIWVIGPPEKKMILKQVRQEQKIIPNLPQTDLAPLWLG